MVKKQVIELLSALCVYSPEGYHLALDALDTFKKMKKLRYRFSLLVTELRTTELVAYKTTLMALVNCLLVACHGDIHDRCRMRSEFIGLNILDIIHNLRNEEDEDLIIQCDVFDDEKTADDEALSAEMAPDIDVTNHRAVFEAVYQKVYNTPTADPFLHILQTMLQMEQDGSISDKQWTILELAAQRILHLDSSRIYHTLPHTAVDRLLRAQRPTFDLTDQSVQTDDLPCLTRVKDDPCPISPSTGESAHCVGTSAKRQSSPTGRCVFGSSHDLISVKQQQQCDFFCISSFFFYVKRGCGIVNIVVNFGCWGVFCSA
ncbi:hypothetical protein ACOMHN_038875 [Nucella lapillus]